jgi:predicted acyltransferase
VPSALARWKERWGKNTNSASAFDAWFLNLFPRNSTELLPPNKGGYTTLNFVPSMATMLLGLLCGQCLRGIGGHWGKCLWLLGVGVACITLGYLAGIGPDGPWSEAALCPLVKRIWTPSWALYSGGLCVLILLGFYFVVDVVGLKTWAFPLVVVGTNSIAMYLLGQLMRPWVRGILATHLASDWVKRDFRWAFGETAYTWVYAWSPKAEDLKVIGNHAFQGTVGPVIESLLILAFFWVICLWMYRRKVFLKV